jgi:hypothetical protein
MHLSALVWTALLPFAFQAPAIPPAQSQPGLQRIAVIGASGSAGFGVSVRLADALEAEIRASHEAMLDLADELVFLSPESSGEAQVERARAFRPTLVFGFDFLFWFGYGDVAKESDRLELLQDGLELLESFDCPLVLSLFPDMSPAIGKMLAATQVPKAETLVLLNQRLEAWAQKRGKVVLLPLPTLLEAMRGDRPLLVGGRLWPAGSTKALLQPDQLHPTQTGLLVVARLAADLLVENKFGFGADDFEQDFDAAKARLQAIADKKRAERLEKLREHKEKLPAPEKPPAHAERPPAQGEKNSPPLHLDSQGGRGAA